MHRLPALCSLLREGSLVARAAPTANAAPAANAALARFAALASSEQLPDELHCEVAELWLAAVASRLPAAAWR